MRKVLLFISIALFMLSVVLFTLPINIDFVEYYYSGSFILALILLAVSDFMKFKLTKN